MAKLHVLGSGRPVPTPTRFGTCHIVESGGRKFMFDCGPGTTYKMSKKGWHALDIDVLCFSHHHFDGK